MKSLIAAALGLAFLSSSAHAQTEAGASSFQGYYIPRSDLKYVAAPGAGSGTDHGDGYGIRSVGMLGEHLALAGELQKTHYDTSDFNVTRGRVGIGLVSALSSGVFAEYLSQRVSSSAAARNDDGWGLRARLASQIRDGLRFYGELGYVHMNGNMESASGYEYTAGASFTLTRALDVFADYRHTDLTGDHGGSITSFSDVRAGLQLRF